MIKDLLKGNVIKNLEDRAKKLHALATKSLEKMERLSKELDTAKKDRVSALVDNLELDTEDRPDNSRIVAVQRELMEEEQVYKEIIRRRASAIGELYAAKHEADEKEYSKLMAEHKTYQEKIEKLQEQIKELGDKADSIHNQARIYDRPCREVARRYIGNYEEFSNDFTFPGDLRKLREIYNEMTAKKAGIGYENNLTVEVTANGEITQYEFAGGDIYDVE